MDFCPYPTHWRSETHFAQSNLIILHHFQPWEPRTCWRYWIRADLHPVSGIIIAASRRSDSVFYVTATIGFCRIYPRCWVINTCQRVYLTSICRWNSSRAHKDFATCYAESRRKQFVGHLFYRLYRSQKRIGKAFLSIYYYWSHRHGWKSLDKVFDRSIEWWTQSIIFMDAFAACTHSSAPFLPPVTNFGRTRMEEKPKRWSLTAKGEGFP